MEYIHEHSRTLIDQITETSCDFRPLKFTRVGQGPLEDVLFQGVSHMLYFLHFEARNLENSEGYKTPY